MNRDALLARLREEDPARLQSLWDEADAVRRATVGDAVHLRGLIEVSNHCVRTCAYCGLRAPRTDLPRYRMTTEEVLASARLARDAGFGTVVLQGGEDEGLGGEAVADWVRRIKGETGLAVTLSLGERPGDFRRWRAAGADRYLLRFETSDAALYRRIHPDRPGRVSDRVALLRRLREEGFEIGGGVMVGIPAQTVASLADDLLLFRRLDLDMIGIGPYIPHPETPLGRGEAARTPVADQAPTTETMACKMLALARLVCPEANLPSTTALATLDPAAGRETGLARGANVVMPNLTPPVHRRRYEIYPAKACLGEEEDFVAALRRTLVALGRPVATGPGHRIRATEGNAPC